MAVGDGWHMSGALHGRHALVHFVCRADAQLPPMVVRLEHLVQHCAWGGERGVGSSLV